MAFVAGAWLDAATVDRIDARCKRARSSASRRAGSVRVSANATTNGASNAGQIENVVIIGSGPAGYTAAIYAARANLRPVVLEGLRAGAAGGQLMTTSDVENYPGFVDGITGPDLMAQFRAQALRWGALVLTDDALSVQREKGRATEPLYSVNTRANGVIKSNAIIIATGATAKRLGLPSEELFWSRGISACATCDGPLFKGRPIAVIGGGDSAAEEASYMTKYATHVYLLVRGERMKASKAMQNRVFANPQITVLLNTEAVDVYGATLGDDLPGLPVRGLRIRTKGQKSEDLPVRGVFYAIGHRPNTDIFDDFGIELDSTGYVRVKPGTPETTLNGVFAAGDVQDRQWRQAVTAAGTGCMAALAAERYLEEHGLTVEVASGAGQYSNAADADAEEEPEEPEDKTNFDIELTKHTGQYALRRLYHESSRPILVKYVSPSCGPCKQLRPILGRVVDEYHNKIHYVEIDIAKDAEIAESAGVTGTPTVQVFLNKAKMGELRGIKMRADYRRSLDKCLAEATLAA